MDHLKAWQIAGRICDMLHQDGIGTTARQHEKMSDIIKEFDDKVWDDRYQRWLQPDPVSGKYRPYRPRGSA